MRTALGVALLLVALTACSGGSSGSAGPDGGQQGAPSKAALAAMKKSQDTLHALGHTLAGAGAGLSTDTPVPCLQGPGVTAAPPVCVGFDGSQACTSGGGNHWPQRAGYNVNFHLGSDALGASGGVFTALTTAHWNIPLPSDLTALHRDYSGTQPDGSSIRVTFDDMPEVATIEMYGPCINADGTVRRP